MEFAGLGLMFTWTSPGFMVKFQWFISFGVHRRQVISHKHRPVPPRPFTPTATLVVFDLNLTLRLPFLRRGEGIPRAVVESEIVIERCPFLPLERKCLPPARLHNTATQYSCDSSRSPLTSSLRSVVANGGEWLSNNRAGNTPVFERPQRESQGCWGSSRSQ